MQIKIIKKYYLHTLRWQESKRQRITSVGKDVEKLEPSYTAGRIIK